MRGAGHRVPLRRQQRRLFGGLLPMTDPRSAAMQPPVTPPAGGTWRQFAYFALRRPTIVRGLKVACVITPILTLMNHYHEIVTLNLSVRFWLQTVMTFCVPYAVSTYSSAMQAVADHRRQTGGHAG